MGQIKGTVNALWALVLAVLFWPIVAFYQDGAIAWVLQIIWLFVVGFLYFSWRHGRREHRVS